MPIAADASDVEVDREGRICQGGEDELNSCERSREKKSEEKEVSDRIPPRK